MAVFTAAAAIGSAVLGAVGITAVGVTFTTVAVGFAAQAALGLALNALTPKPKAPSFTNSTARQGYTVNQRGSALEHQIIYGTMRTGGAVVFDSTTGTTNKFLHRVIAFTGHEIESFDEIYINDAKVSILESDGNVKEIELPDGTLSNRYDGFIRINKKFGSDDQEADSDLVAEVPEWTAQHRLRGVSYLYARLKFNSDKFPNGVPQITATIKGKKVFDPRTSTTAFSDNPALCLRDYILSGYGLGEEVANIDDDLVIAAANVCDETDTLAGTKRYTCNGAFTTALTPYDLLQDMLTSMGGLLWYAQGQWRMKPAYYVAPTVSFDEDDLRSSIAVQTRHSRRDNFNTVRGTFRGPETDYQVTDYPEVTNAAFLSADGGQESVADIELPFTDTSVTARRIARIALERNRQQLTVQASFGLRAFQVQVGDIVQLSVERFGWTNKEFEVSAWTFGLTDGQDLQVQMVLREISESVFDEIDDGIVYERDNTSLATPFETFAPGVALDPQLRVINEQVVGVLVINLSGGDNGFTDFFEVEYKRSEDTNFIFAGRSRDNTFEIPFLSDGNFDVRVRSVSFLGVRSEFTTITRFFATFFSDPPANVENFTGNVVGNSLHLSWDAVPDLDLSHYKIRYATETSGAAYQNAVDLILKVSRPGLTATVPARQGTYFIKAVDKTGNPSANSSSFVVTTNIAQIEDLNVVETLTEDPDFTGNKTNVVLTTDSNGDNYITLDTENLFDSASGDFDDELGLFDAGGEDGTISATGVYEFANYIDLSEKYSNRVSVDVSTIFLDYVNTFDSATSLFDAREGDFDGDPSQFDLTSVQPQVSFTDDDPSGTPNWSNYQNISVSDIDARAVRFRVILSTQSNSAAPAVTALSAEVDMPDRVEADSDITYTGSANVTFPVAFKVPPSLGIAATLADGDRYEITNKTRTGFTIETLSGATTSTNPTTIDYVAKGYGREIA